MLRILSVVVLFLALAVGGSGCSKDPQAAKHEFVRSGDAYVAQSKFREASVEYRNAIQNDPKFGEARRKLAETYLQIGDAVGAYQEFIRAADLLPEDIHAQQRAGEMLLLARRFEDAKARADKILARTPGQVEALILRANALAGLNRLDDAINEVEQAIASAPDRSASYASLGTMQLISGDKVQAEAAFKKAVLTEPRSTRARLALANFFWMSDRRDEAEHELKAALAIDARDPLANRAMAYFYLGSRRTAEAEPYLKVVADVVPNSSGKLVLADYYVATDRRDNAKQLLEQVVATDSDGLPTAKLRLAGLALSARDTATAAKLVDDVLSKQSTNAEALIAKAQVLVNGEKFDEALTTVRRATEAAPRSAQAWFATGRVRASRQEPDEAITAFNEALELNPRLATAEVELSKLHLAAGRLKEAEQFAASALTKISGYAEAHLLLARINLAKGNPQKAEPSLRMLAKALPDSPGIQTEVGLLELSKKNYPAAREAFSRVLQKNPDSVDALAGLTRTDLLDKHHDAAKKRIDDVVQRYPQNTRILLLASRTYRTIGEASKAERVLQQAIAVDPNTLDAYGMLGQLYASQGKLAEATAQFEKITERQPKSVSAHTTVAILFNLQNRMSEARARYEQVLEIDPNAAVAANNLAWIYAVEGGNLDIALQLAQTAKSRLPDQPEVNDTLGWIYHKRGLDKLAIPPLLMSVAKDPKNASYHYHVGMAYAANGDTKRARAFLERSLALDATFDGAAEARQVLEGLKG